MNRQTKLRAVLVGVLAFGYLGTAWSSSPVVAAKGWETASLNFVEGQVEKLRAARMPCVEFMQSDYSMLSDDYHRKGLPIPTVAATCTAEGDENLLFEVFADSSIAAKFLEEKRLLLCEAAARSKIDFPGFIYVAGGHWVVEPDEQKTAVELARILGGVVRTADCPLSRPAEM